MCCILVRFHFLLAIMFVMNSRLTGTAVPYKSQWLTGIGLAFFFLNLCLFVMNCVLISLRFYWRSGSLIESFNDQYESLFISAIVSLLPDLHFLNTG